MYKGEGHTDAVSISASVGGLPLGPFFAMAARRLRQCLASTSIRPSVIPVRWERKARKYGSKFFDGGKVTSNTHNSCQPRNVLSLQGA
jgi:hypothetical protein